MVKINTNKIIKPALVVITALALAAGGYTLGRLTDDKTVVHVVDSPNHESQNKTDPSTTNPSCQINQTDDKTTCTLQYNEASEVKIKFEPARVSPSLNINCQSQGGCSTVTDNSGATVKVTAGATLKITVSNTSNGYQLAGFEGSDGSQIVIKYHKN